MATFVMNGLAVVALLGVAAYLLVRFNSLWVYRYFDRSLRNKRDKIDPDYELPKYYRLKADGKEVDTGVRWPGWDGWYFFMFPDDPKLPLKMVRASLMTGMYGLEGIDNYEMLQWRLSTFDVAEYLALVPTDETVEGKSEKENHLSQHYLPKKTALRMDHKKLNVSLKSTKIEEDEEKTQIGRISGTWPDYHFVFTNLEAEIEIDLQFKGENLLWWADIWTPGYSWIYFPHVFTYFCAFGRFEGTVTYRRGVSKEDSSRLMENPVSYTIKGSGGFEHGFAQKPFDFDRFYNPIRLIQSVFSRFKPVRYHYELFLDDTAPLRGGFMKARGFGIDFRNRGGFYLDGKYREIRKVQIEYLEEDKDEARFHCARRAPVTFYRKWKVRATTDGGVLEYEATREWPPARISSNMIYYHFSYEGSYRSEKFRGRGYGEYVHV